MHVFTVIPEPTTRYEHYLEVVAVQKTQFPIPVQRGNLKTTVFASNIRNITVERVSEKTRKTWVNFITNVEELGGERSALLDETHLTREALLSMCVEMPQADETDELTPKRIHTATLSDEFLAGISRQLNMNSGVATILRAAAAKWGRKYTLVLMEEEKQ